MSATQKSNITRLEQLDRRSTQLFPNSRKIYLTGSHPGVRVLVREISLTDTFITFGGEKNLPVFVYDTSGPYTDPKVHVDLRKDLPDMCSRWIDKHGDTKILPGLASELGQTRLADAGLDALRFAHVRTPRRAEPGANASRMHYTKKGIIAPKMEYITIRENVRLQEARAADLPDQQHPGHSFGANIPKEITPESIREEVARGHAVIPTNINHTGLGPMIISRSFLVRINDNIGSSALGSSIEGEVEKLTWDIR